MKGLGLSLLLACGLATGAIAATGEGTIAGRVVITKALTKRRVSLPAYELRGVAVRSAPEDDGAVNELSRVVIYLEGAGLRAGVPGKATLTQKDRRFSPEIVVIPAGSTVSFPNADPIFHNVFSLSKAKSFDLGYYPAGQTRTVRFDRPGIVQVYCHIHTDMSAAIVVVPSSQWTRPAADGTFSLAGIPAGDYELMAWHRSAGFFRRKVTVGAGGTIALNLLIPVKTAGAGLAAGAGGDQ